MNAEGIISMRIQDFIILGGLLASVIYTWVMVKVKVNGVVPRVSNLEKEINKLTGQAIVLSQVEIRIVDFKQEVKEKLINIDSQFINFKDEFRGKLDNISQGVERINERYIKHIAVQDKPETTRIGGC